MDHDQLFKELLPQFLPELIALALPEWADDFDFTEVEWLQQEVFPDPPAGQRRSVDLVVRVKVKDDLPGLRPGEKTTKVLLIHIEIEAEDSVEALRGRLFDYRQHLRSKHGLQVLPLAVYLRVGGKGVGWDVYEERFRGRTLVHFEYPYLGLPALNALTYLRGDNWLGVALSALMKIPAGQRAEVKVEAADRIARGPLNAYQRYLLYRCVDSYLELADADRARYEALLRTPKYAEGQNMLTGQIVEAEAKGERKMLARLLERRFGPLSPAVQERLANWPANRLGELGEAFADGKSLQELGLEEEPGS